jgi:O-succinylbenzoic acid--CoA ligase
MIRDYPYRSIQINNRTLSLEDIRSGSVDPLNIFEASTLRFIADWFNDQDTFTQATSGATGKPKMIALTRHQMVASSRLTQHALNLGQRDTALLCLDPAYIAGKMMLARSFVTGMRVVAVDPVADPFAMVPTHITIDFAAVVPLQLRAILDGSSKDRLQTTRQVIVGGGKVDHDLEQRLRVLETRLFATYGMTETISHIALRPLNGPKASRWYRALPGIDVRQDDRQCCVISWDALAEDVVTNDIIEIRSPTCFRWVGRWDNVINTGGLKVIPEELEPRVAQILSDIGLTMPFFIGSAADEVLGQRVILALAGDIREPTVTALWNALHVALARHEVPREIKWGQLFLYTETGKIRRSESLQRLQSIMKPSERN